MVNIVATIAACLVETMKMGFGGLWGWGCWKSV